METQNSGKIVGYARVSTDYQNLDLQIDALKKAGCQKKDIFIDKVSGAKSERPGLNACMNSLGKGDTLLVWRLDRLGRSMPHLVSVVESLKEQEIGFRSICDGAINTTTASGELVFNIFSSLAQFERRLIQERTRAGLVAARSRGRKGGRRAIKAENPKVVTAKKMHQDKSLSIDEICQSLKISRATFYRYLEK
ncbi:MAG: recombinase family protein [gamma proteobacterium symbiont of Bathyaustriella thionipta]|nr:recombinase family protein [gamma proteobacterium symbiont of Bathyaustriella thionipta]MCU7950460.1 recombinase family protein [gamma proteobacterium symbiont of Bathyaustriella thionipta]MCU7953636.1 recombinase family protein [gamma proteobacterium symbiont of Bathyaustriella thionipta]MCU7956970.1 recombinase family protein [gamma proteobacterium symbiont of Bathyaustriella thionipta]MCU7966959.1 recombinase family protein [gamma proteobacterium symbiont of Bathyaustriella thionipta]